MSFKLSTKIIDRYREEQKLAADLAAVRLDVADEEEPKEDAVLVIDEDSVGKENLPSPMDTDTSNTKPSTSVDALAAIRHKYRFSKSTVPLVNAILNTCRLDKINFYGNQWTGSLDPVGAQCKVGGGGGGGAGPSRSTRLKCSHCPGTFENAGNLAYHQQRRHSELFVKECSKCHKYFQNQKDLCVHEVKKHSPPATRYRCHRCPRMFTLARTYEEHLEGHRLGTVRTVHKCPQCPLAFPTKSNMTSHRKSVHQNIRPFRCVGHCEQAFKRKEHLDLHLLRYQGVKPYRCTYVTHGTVCDYASTYHSDVVKHVRGYHFKLPVTKKRQYELNIEDNREPRKFIRMVHVPVKQANPQ